MSTFADPNILDAQLRSLKSQCRNTRLLCYLILAIAAFLGYSYCRQRDAVSSRRFELHNEHGRPVAVLRTMDDGSPTLFFGGTSSSNRLQLGVNGNSAYLVLRDTSHQHRLSLVVRADGIPVLSLLDGHGGLRASLDLMERDSPCLTLLDSAKKQRVRLGTFDDWSYLDLCDKTQKARASFALRDEDTYLTMRDSASLDCAVLYYSAKDRTSSLSLNTPQANGWINLTALESQLNLELFDKKANNHIWLGTTNDHPPRLQFFVSGSNDPTWEAPPRSATSQNAGSRE